MNSVDPLEIVFSFTKEESFVCYYKLNGKEHKEIALMMGKRERDIQDYSSEVFRKSGVPGKDKEGLKNKVGALMFVVADKVEWKDWEWPTKQLSNMMLQKAPAASPWRETPPEPVSPPKIAPVRPVTPSISWQERILNFAKNRNYQIIAAILVFLLIIGFFFLRPHHPASPLPTSTTIPIVGIYPVSTTQIFTSPINVETPTFTLTPSIPPTDTTKPSPTLTPTPTQNPNIIIEDNFNDSINPKWELLTGVPIIVDGYMETQNHIPIWLSTDVKGDFKITIRMSQSDCGNITTFKIAVAFIDAENYFGYSGAGCGGWWDLNGSQLNPGYVTDFEQKPTLIITLIGDKATAEVGGVILGSAINPIKASKVGIMINSGSIDYIQILSLP